MSSVKSPDSAVDRLVRHQQWLDARLRRYGVSHSLRRAITATLLASKAPQIQSGIAALFAEFLGEPVADARRLSADWLYYRSIARAGWLSGACAAESVKREIQPRVLDETALGAFLSGSLCNSRGVLMASIHMGDYLRGLAALGDCLQGRRVLILRKRDAGPGERSAFEAFSRAGIRFEVLRHDRMAAFTALRALKRGAVVVVLYDLSHRWGRTAPVQLFGREAHMVCGPVELATMAGADVLPVVTGFDDTGTLEVRAGKVLSGKVLSGKAHEAESGEVRAVLQQRLAGFAERAIRARPAQWHHWPLLPELLVRKQRVDARVSDTPAHTEVSAVD